MTNLMAPYRFIPLSSYILRPDWAKAVSHDHPFADGVSGELELALTTQTRLCVGGHQEQANEHQPGKVHFYRTPDQHLAIPATSLKGMLRNVMEIACFGHFRQVENQQLGVRDISSADNFYCKAIKPGNVHSVLAGWLQFDHKQGQWSITPCNYARIYQGDLINHFEVNKNQWNGKKLAKDRYQLLGGLKNLSFDIDHTYQYDCKKLATNLGKGAIEGTVVITGQPGLGFDQPNKNGSIKANKKREFVFYETQTSEALQVENHVISGFMRIHEESNEWKYWLNKLSDPQKSVPVFFHKDNQGGVKSLGLSSMYRLPYEYSLHDAISHTRPEHLESEHPDLPGLIFGWMDEQASSGQNSLRGRVLPGLFELTQETPTRWEDPTVLSGPKPTFYPAYIHQTLDKGSYKTLMDKDAKLAGWKRYPVQEQADLPQLSTDIDNKNVQVVMETLPEGCIFEGKMRLHNLRLLELGALLWVIDFGQRNLNHSLGLGKPYGFGQVKLQIKGHKLQPYASHLQNLDAELLLQTARVSFQHYMDQVWQQAAQTEAKWESSPQVTALLNSLDPKQFRGQALEYYPKTDDFVSAKKNKLRLPPLVAIDLPEPTPQVSLASPAIELDASALTQQAQASLDALAAEKEKQAQKAEREAKKAEMSSEDQEIAAVEDCYLEAEPGLTKTLEKNLTKLAIQLYDTSASWEAETKLKVGKLGEKIFALAKREGKETAKLGKAAKKLMRYLD